MDETKDTKIVAFRVPVKIYEKLLGLIEQRDISMSQFMRAIVMAFFVEAD